MAPIMQTELGNPNSPFDQRWHGRRYAPDPRDRKHTMESVVRGMKASDLKRRTQAPAHGPTLNQGPTPRCVMFSAATALGALPIGYQHNPLAVVSQPLDQWSDLYGWAQAHDEWPGEDYEGTSVRAGQEYLKGVGRSTGYVWARDLAEAKDYISRVGSAPIILGIDWLDKMDEPKKIGDKYWLDVDGPVVGGHAICALWYSKKLGAWKLQNTWGEDWADGGIVYLADDLFDYLVFQANGEAASFIEAPAK